jgi:hypothetical protein
MQHQQHLYRLRPYKCLQLRPQQRPHRKQQNNNGHAPLKPISIQP